LIGGAKGILAVIAITGLFALSGYVLFDFETRPPSTTAYASE